MQCKVGRNLNRRTRRASRSGFSLIEVLVVLAILVILFGLLFAPMMAGMDMARTGGAQARLQDTIRLAAEQMRRELSTAMYVYPPPTYNSNSGQITDYAQLVFVLPATDSTGQTLTPRQPRTFTNSGGATEYLATRYYVKAPIVDVDHQYDETNPFVLVRQEGLYRYNVSTGRYDFGSEDASGTFKVGRAISQNVVTPTENYDIPATSTICLDDGQMEIGYVPACPTDGSTNLLYLHDNVQFRPERIVGEAMVPAENNTIYSARHGNWMGTANNGTVALTTGALSAKAPELQPRLVDYRWDNGGYKLIALDTFTNSIRSDIKLRWNTTNGTVQVGDWRTVSVHVDCTTDPGTAFWPVTIDGTDQYNSAGTLAGTQKAPLVPIYPSAPANPADPRMPIAYRIDPSYSDGANVVAKVVPASTRAMALTTGGGDAKRGQWTRVDDINQADLGAFEYSEFLPSTQTSCEMRFNRYTPPSPDTFPGITAYDLYISYYYRRNFDSVTGRDDVIFADYSTGEIINITLIPQHFTELQAYKAGAPNLVVPPDLPVGGVPVRTQAVVSNARF